MVPDVSFYDFSRKCENGNVWYKVHCTPYGYGYDVKTESVDVQQKIAEHLSLLLQIGVTTISNFETQKIY